MHAPPCPRPSRCRHSRQLVHPLVLGDLAQLPLPAAPAAPLGQDLARVDAWADAKVAQASASPGQPRPASASLGQPPPASANRQNHSGWPAITVSFPPRLPHAPTRAHRRGAPRALGTRTAPQPHPPGCAAALVALTLTLTLTPTLAPTSALSLALTLTLTPTKAHRGG